ncbi:unnamed protein product [Allacma fusca]|uniref:Histone deacetylase domain-containing protein n=1 Tax=Allacma fusca TaxID=39272 RepID=A0A8J2P8V1_9HEXA|nr:unnamed protein product [Allacma fusca]
MSELEEKDFSKEDLEAKILDLNGSNSPVFVRVNANSPVLNLSPSQVEVAVSALVSSNGNESNPATRGATSVNKRSKRPQAKPSSALMQAKLNAQIRKRNSEGKSDITFVIKDHLQLARDAKEQVRKPSGVVYDMRMVEHHCLWDSSYPEKPERFSVVIQRCQQLGLLDRCLSIVPRYATEEEVSRVHPKEHIDKLRSICEEGGQNPNLEKMEQEASHFDAVYFHPSTYNLSLLAAGCTIDLVNAVLAGELQNGMAIIRPPGHHAMKSEFCGYCYFNNVAIAAQLALDSGSAKRILVVDFDVHHGQATQQAFYNDPR